MIWNRGFFKYICRITVLTWNEEILKRIRIVIRNRIFEKSYESEKAKLTGKKSGNNRKFSHPSGRH